MRNKKYFILGMVIILGGVALGQRSITVQEVEGGAVSGAQVQVFAAENSFTSDTSEVPVPRGKPIWEGQTDRHGKVEIPRPLRDGQPGLVWVQFGGLHGFAVLAGQQTAEALNIPVILRQYRTMHILAKDRSGGKVPNIPVYVVDSIELSSHHFG